MPDPKKVLFSLGSAYVCALGLSGALLFTFYDHFLSASDDGLFCHIAERLYHGEVLGRDVIGTSDYIHFINRAAFALAGVDMVSLRYPLVLVGLLQCSLMFWLFAERHRGVAILAATALTSVSFIQFLNPSASWYCLFLTICIIVLLHRCQGKPGPAILITIGILTGGMFLLRQPTGVFVGCTLIMYLLATMSDGASGRQRILSQGIVLAILIILGLYCIKSADPLTFILFGIWPLLFGIFTLPQIRTSNHQTLKIGLLLLLGVVFSFLPLLWYHGSTGTISRWLYDTWVMPFHWSNLPIFGIYSYSFHLLAPFYHKEAAVTPLQYLNRGYWWVLINLAILNGGLLLLQLLKNRQNVVGVLRENTLPFFAAFYALVSMQLQIPIYLYYSAGLSLCGILWTAARSTKDSLFWSMLFVPFCAVAVYCHAGQPHVRDGLRGIRIDSVPSEGLGSKIHLKIDPNLRDSYSQILSVIERESSAQDTIFVIPYSPELYFLSGRRNPFPFAMSSVVLSEPEQLENVLATLRNTSGRPSAGRSPAPRLVIHKDPDKYGNEVLIPVLEYVTSHYRLIETVDAFHIYKLVDSH